MMATYLEWTRAIAFHVTRDRPPRSPVYLHLSSEVLQVIAPTVFVAEDEAERDFIHAVRSACLFVNQLGQERVDTAYLSRWSPIPGSLGAIPNGIGFLALTVLAASRMGERDDIDHRAYFPIVRELLGGLPATHSQQARPPGWDLGDEAEWWSDWRDWLATRRLDATYKYGQGPWTYVRLPVSQTLLRQTDEDRLLRLFSQYNDFRSSLSDRSLMRRVRRYAELLTAQLRRLIDDPERLTEVTEAVFGLHTDWRSGLRSPGSAGTHDVRAPAFLVRTSDFLEGVEYSLQSSSGNTTVLQEVPGQVLAEGWEGSADGKRYRLPKRDIWVMAVTDEALLNVMTSVAQPTGDAPITVLARRTLVPQLRRLHRMGLVQWPGDWERLPEPIDGWVEIEDCRVVPGSWPDEGVADALRPRERLRVSFTQGMAIGDRFVWLEGHTPAFTIHSEFTTRKSLVRIFSIATAGEYECSAFEVENGVPASLPGLRPGLYRLTCSGSERGSTRHDVSRVFEIKTHSDLSIGEIDPAMRLNLNSSTVFGAHVLSQ